MPLPSHNCFPWLFIVSHSFYNTEQCRNISVAAHFHILSAQREQLMNVNSCISGKNNCTSIRIFKGLFESGQVWAHRVFQLNSNPNPRASVWTGALSHNFVAYTSVKCSCHNLIAMNFNTIIFAVQRSLRPTTIADPSKFVTTTRRLVYFDFKTLLNSIRWIRIVWCGKENTKFECIFFFFTRFSQKHFLNWSFDAKLWVLLRQ